MTTQISGPRQETAAAKPNINTDSVGTTSDKSQLPMGPACLAHGAAIVEDLTGKAATTVLVAAAVRQDDRDQLDAGNPLEELQLAGGASEAGALPSPPPALRPMTGLHIPVLPKGVSRLDAAFLYAAAGWYTVPIRLDTKHPGLVLGKGWPEKSSRNPQDLNRWFARSGCGLALHVGRSGALVV